MYKGTILIVEDKDEFRKIYGDRLRFAKYEVLDAGNGDEALNLLRKEKIDLVITDINMPKKDGYELIQEMKTDDSLKHIPVIVMSVYDQGDHIKKALMLGAADYLVKGMYTPNTVTEKVDAIIAKR